MRATSGISRRAPRTGPRCCPSRWRRRSPPLLRRRVLLPLLAHQAHDIALELGITFELQHLLFPLPALALFEGGDDVGRDRAGVAREEDDAVCHEDRFLDVM